MEMHGLRLSTEGDQPPDRCPDCGATGINLFSMGRLPESLERLLKEAFAGESKAQVRNQAFARRGLPGRLPSNRRPF